MPAIADGNCATIPDKMMSEMPLPMPRDVICSPSHIRNMVPPASVMVVDIRKKMPGLLTTLPVPSRPTPMPYAWNAASTTVRYRVYWFMILRPCSPSFLSASSVGETVVISWMMIEAEMYGMMLSANIAIRWMPPPENMLNMPRMPPA